MKEYHGKGTKDQIMVDTKWNDVRLFTNNLKMLTPSCWKKTVTKCKKMV